MFSEVVTVPLCNVLEEGRGLAGLSLQNAAAAVGIDPQMLLAFEQGTEHPPGELVPALARLYQLDPERLGTEEWVVRSEPALDVDEEILWLEWLPIRYTAQGASNDAILDTVADGIRMLRDLSTISPIHMRSDELRLVMSVLDLDDPDLTRSFVQAFRLPWKRAEFIVAEARHHVRTSSLESRVKRLQQITGN